MKCRKMLIQSIVLVIQFLENILLSCKLIIILTVNFQNVIVAAQISLGGDYQPLPHRRALRVEEPPPLGEKWRGAIPDHEHSGVSG